jgi:hypothetical protein
LEIPLPKFKPFIQPRDLIGTVSSYYSLNTDTIFLYFFRDLSDEELALKVLMLDISHETLHHIIKCIENKKTTIAYDNIAEELEANFLNPRLWKTFNRVREVKENEREKFRPRP